MRKLSSMLEKSSQQSWCMKKVTNLCIAFISKILLDFQILMVATINMLSMSQTAFHMVILFWIQISRTYSIVSGVMYSQQAKNETKLIKILFSSSFIFIRPLVEAPQHHQDRCPAHLKSSHPLSSLTSTADFVDRGNLDS